MKQFSQQLHKKAASSVKLRDTEKRDLKARLVSYMEYHPLPSEMKTKTQAVKVKQSVETLVSEPFKLVKIPFNTILKYSAGVAVLLLTIVPFAAEKAVPGDTLYAIKVQFNEELRSTLTLDSYKKVEWETERLNRRIAEARLLASEGKLTNEVEAEVAEAVRTHTNNVKREIEHLRTEDADEAAIASIALDTTLAVQSTTLKNDLESQGDEAVSELGEGPVSNLITDAIDESRSEVVAEEGVNIPDYDKMMAKVEANTTRVLELRDSLGDILSTEELGEVNRRIEDISRSVGEAMSLRAENEDEAGHLLVNILQRTQGLVVYMSELEVNHTVDIEDLVPVVLTNEEKQANINEISQQFANKIAAIDKAITEFEDDDVLAKVAAGQAQLAGLQSKIASTSVEDYDVLTSLYNEANTMADDILSLLGKSEIEFEMSSTTVASTTTGVSTSTDSEIETTISTTSEITSSTADNEESIESENGGVESAGESTESGEEVLVGEQKIESGDETIAPEEAGSATSLDDEDNSSSAE